MPFLDDDKWKPKRVFDHRQNLPPPPRLFREVRWASRLVRLGSTDGKVWKGPTGSPGLLLILRRDGNLWVASLEDEVNNNTWAGEPKMLDRAAVANLQRQAERIGRSTE